MKYLIIGLMFCSINLSAQQITGVITDNKNQPLPGASIHWSGTTVGTIADENGRFRISNETNKSQLVISFIGFKNDTITAIAGRELKIVLITSDELGSVEIIAKKNATDISTIKPRNIERINEKELLKAACCNLSESFETNPTIDVNYADAVTGAKEIQMLGLSGVYTQLLNEAIPGMTGLGSIYGLNYIPGPWMESIQISKGAGSVVNGYEAITGQINIEYKKPETMKERMFINVFADDDRRVELNTINSIKLNDDFYDILMIHGSMNQWRMDMNDDNFLDMPLAKQVNIYNKLSYNSGKRLEGQAGFRIIAEERLGGEMNFEKAEKGSSSVYGALINSRRYEAFTKTGMVNPKKRYQSMGLQLNAVYHTHDSWIGLRTYNAEQQSFYANYSYITKLFSEKHIIRMGADMKIDEVTEIYNGREFTNKESVPGIYTEYTLNTTDKFGIIAGMRADYHNNYGWFYSPRANLKYNFTPDVIVRVSGGKGYRTPLTFADNIGVMVSSKTFIIMEEPDAEEAWNGGVNFTARFKMYGREGSFSGDYYYTSFINQYLIDQFSVPGAVLYYNLNGKSTASSLQATITYELVKGLDVKIAGKLDDVSTDYIYRNNAQRPLYAREKGLVNIAYETPKKRWRIDATWQWNGPKPLPSRITDHSHEMNTKSESESYSIFNFQITKVLRTWEIYIGGENLNNFMQHDPILNASEPFAQEFDGSSVWGPVTGRKIYGGVRIKIF